MGKCLEEERLFYDVKSEKQLGERSSQNQDHRRIDMTWQWIEWGKKNVITDAKMGRSSHEERV